jgi:heme-degrading monooxygenase HmoA
MNVHIAIYKWKPATTTAMIGRALNDVESLSDKIPGIIEVSTGKNTSKHGKGFTHAILVRGDSQEAIDAYRSHPDHEKIANFIESIEYEGIGIDFSTR